MGYPTPMKLFLDSFWRALAYCFFPRVILLSLIPLAFLLTITLGWAYFYWDATQEWVRDVLGSWLVLSTAYEWLQDHGAGHLQSVLVPIVVILTITPLLVVISLLSVSFLMSPGLINLVIHRRFSHLARKHGGTFMTNLIWTVTSTIAALIAMLVTLPLWLIPPLMFVIPPIIWGWLSYRVMVFDVLVDIASRDERILIGKQHRLWLLLIGVITGFMGGFPSLVWASAAMFADAFVVLVPLAVWIYGLVFAFTSLWFAHYTLAALQALREESDLLVVGATVPVPALASGDEHSAPPTPP
jgi:Etoposide-induced protein 2.4 (EI24)